MTTPPMTINPYDLLDDEKMRNGPMVVFWNQDEEIRPNREFPDYDLPRRPFHAWLFRLRRFKMELRLAPPPDEKELAEWGARVAKTLGVTWGDPLEGDRAAYVIGYTFARNAPAAIATAGYVLKKLDEFHVGAVQVRVEAR